MSDKDSAAGSKENPIQARIKQLPNGRFIVQIHDGRWIQINDLSYSDVDRAVSVLTEFLKDKSGGHDVFMKTAPGEEFTLKGSQQ